MSARAEPVTGMVICLNEARRIGDCLRSLAFCDEIVVIDSGSTDGTQAIVERAGARLITRPFVSWNDQKDFGRSQARSPWVLNIDADEVVDAELAAEITALAERGAPPAIAAYRFRFKNFLRDAWIRSCGFYPDPHVRLVRRDRCRWDTAHVHDKIGVDGAVGDLRGHVEHHSFESIADYLEKSNIYAEAFARDAIARGRTSGVGAILTHTLARFVRSYFIHRGVLDGALGLTMAGLQAAGTFQKYVRLWEMQRFPEARALPPKTAEVGDPWREQRVGRSDNVGRSDQVGPGSHANDAKDRE